MYKKEKIEIKTLGVRKTIYNEAYYQKISRRYDKYIDVRGKVYGATFLCAFLGGIALLVTPAVLSMLVFCIEGVILFSPVLLHGIASIIDEKKKKTKFDNFVIDIDKKVTNFITKSTLNVFQKVGSKIAASICNKKEPKLDADFYDKYKQYAKLKLNIMKLTSIRGYTKDYDLMINGNVVLPPLTNYNIENITEYVNQGVELLDEKNKQDLIKKEAEQTITAQEIEKKEAKEKGQVAAELIANMRLIAAEKVKKAADQIIEDAMIKYYEADDKLTENKDVFGRQYTFVDNEGCRELNINNK